MDLGNNDLRQSNLFRSGSNLLIERPSRTSDDREYPRGVLNPIDKHVIRTSLNIDSRFRDNYYGTTSSDFTVSLPTKIKRVVQMELGEIEMPISFHTISANYGNNYFWIKESGADPKCVIVPDGNYTGEDLALFVNQEISRLSGHTAIPGIKMIHDLNSNESGSGRIIISRDVSGADLTNFELNFSAPKDNTHNSASYNTTDTSTPLQLKLGWLLGFRYPKYTESTSYVSEGLYETQCPRYVYLVIDDFNNNSHNSIVAAFNSSILSNSVLARVSLKQSNNNLSDNDYGLASAPPTRSYFGPVDIQKLRIQLVDEYGRVLNMNNMDISIVLNLNCIADN